MSSCGSDTRRSATELRADLKRLERDTESPRQGVVAGVVLVALVGAYAGWHWRWRQRNASAIESIAVLPFVNASGDPGQEYPGEGIAVSITNSLSRVPDLKVKARTAVARVKGKDGDPQAVGRELGVQALLMGTRPPDWRVSGGEHRARRRA